jgi:hypothetical protein
MKQKISFLRISVALAVALAIMVAVFWQMGAFAAWRGPIATSNSIMVIQPYRHAGTWVFDDERVNLYREPFVAGVPEMIDTLVADIPAAEQGFRLTFSAREFPGYESKLIWLRQESAGNWYHLEGTDMEGWICPALFEYYPDAPKELYVKADPL